MNPKTKGKEDKGKGSKSVNQNNEEGEDMDFAVLRKPIPTSITGFAQARKIFDLATEEVSISSKNNIHNNNNNLKSLIVPTWNNNMLK